MTIATATERPDDGDERRQSYERVMNLLDDADNKLVEAHLRITTMNLRMDTRELRDQEKRAREERRRQEAAAAQRHEQLMTRLADILQLLVDRGNNGASAP